MEGGGSTSLFTTDYLSRKGPAQAKQGDSPSLYAAELRLAPHSYA